MVLCFPWTCVSELTCYMRWLFQLNATSSWTNIITHFLCRIHGNFLKTTAPGRFRRDSFTAPLYCHLGLFENNARPIHHSRRGLFHKQLVITGLLGALDVLWCESISAIVVGNVIQCIYRIINRLYGWRSLLGLLIWLRDKLVVECLSEYPSDPSLPRYSQQQNSTRQIVYVD